jgi:hypothetical protein
MQKDVPTTKDNRGAMHVAHNDGTEQEISAGQAYVIEPGHDAWVVGDEAVVGL